MMYTASVNTQFIFAFAPLWMTLTLGYSDLDKDTSQLQTNPIKKEKEKSDMDTYTFSMSNKDKLKDMAIIIESLEKLGVLGSSENDCYSMDKIVKSKERIKESEDTWKVGIHIYVREKSNEKGASQNGIADGPTTTSSSQTNTSSRDSGNSTSIIEEDSCATVPGIPLPINDGASNSKAGAGKGTEHKNNDVQLPYRRKSASILSPYFLAANQGDIWHKLH